MNLILRIMKRIILNIAMALALSAGIAGCSASGEVYEEKELSVEQRERVNPSEFIVVNAQYDHDVIGESSITGTLQSKAVKTSYQDVMITVYFYDESGTMVGSNNYVVSQDLSIGETENFKVKVDTPDNTKNVTWSITGANPL
jgi:hypothetical protein